MAEITKGLGNPSKQLSENTVWKTASEHIVAWDRS